jgi:hypothetical protein
MQNDIYHPGERLIQTQLCVSSLANRTAGIIRDKIDQTFAKVLAEQRYCFIGVETSTGLLRSTMVLEPPGFTQASLDGYKIIIRSSAASRFVVDCNVPMGKDIGCLFIHLQKRQRVRVNGRISGINDDSLVIDVQQMFPNCTKYIRQRELKSDCQPSAYSTYASGTQLTDDIITWITTADTFFVTSSQSQGPVDVSHRGGQPGFIRVVQNVLHIPDYPGNNMFATLGNFATNPKASLLFIDFTRNRLLVLSGDVECNVHCDQPSQLERVWSFRLQAWQILTSQDESCWRESTRLS